MGPRIRSFLRAWRGRDRFEEEMRQEMAAHMEEYAAELRRAGVPDGEARRRAAIEFGALNSVQEGCREAFGLHLVDTVARELRQSLRQLRQTPGFTVAAVAMLALCLGANLTIFAAMDAILLRPLPFPAADRLVTVYNTYPKAAVLRDGASFTNYYERRGQLPAFSSLSIYAEGTAIVGGTGSAERVGLLRISKEFFGTLGMSPAMGRGFTEQEMDGNNDTVAILTDRYWKTHFGSQSGVLGKTVYVDAHPKIVVGVLPPAFRFLSSEAQVFIPLASMPQQRDQIQRHSGGNVVQMVARLRPGASLQQAQAQIDEQNGRLEASNPQGKRMAEAGFRTLAVPLRADHTAAVRQPLLLLQAGVLLLLVIGVVNLANLLLVRAISQGKQIAVRLALGATRAHIAAHVLLETSILTWAGGALGLGVGALGIRVLASAGADRLPMGTAIAFDARVGIAALAGAAVLGIVLALPVIWFALRQPLETTLKIETRTGTASHTAQTLRHTFLVAQVALAFVLLAGAGLLALSLRQATAISPGFASERVTSARVSLIGSKYPSAQLGLAFTERLTAELEKEPGVLAAGAANNIPFSGFDGKSAATVKGHISKPGEAPQGHYSFSVAGNYFPAMGFRLVEGRFLDGADSRLSEPVCVVDQDFARRYWRNRSALGQKLWQGSEAQNEQEAFTIVGVVAAAKQSGLTETGGQGAVYYPYLARPASSLFVVARSGGTGKTAAAAIQRTVREIDPELAVSDLRTMNERILDSLLVRRSPALLAAVFSGMALVLIGTGLYGVLSYSVAQRRREIGVRLALGATPQLIRRVFVSLTMRLLCVGLALGWAGVFAIRGAIGSLLFHVSPLDPGMLIVAALVVGAIALCASFVPAWRASYTSPVEALAER